MRGGVSQYGWRCSHPITSSPHARGCFPGDQRGSYHPQVFPACAGVFLKKKKTKTYLHSLPRMRGGVSQYGWRCSHPITSSPHARGCFPTKGQPGVRQEVFPACAGVFLDGRRAGCGDQGLPRMRGGVSKSCTLQPILALSSPHARGCFPTKGQPGVRQEVFPACAGVFLLYCFFLLGFTCTMQCLTVGKEASIVLWTRSAIEWASVSVWFGSAAISTST